MSIDFLFVPKREQKHIKEINEGKLFQFKFPMRYELCFFGFLIPLKKYFL